MWSMLKTTFGYLLFILGIQGGAEIGEIYNYIPISDQLGTSGQPTIEQFGAIKDAGFTTVINLLPSGAENSLKNEGQIVSGLGMKYVYIPVSSKGPTEEDYRSFVTSMQAAEGQKVWIHCAANARVSVFLYRYRTTVLGEDVASVKEDVLKVWKPIGVWKRFSGWE